MNANFTPCMIGLVWSINLTTLKAQPQNSVNRENDGFTFATTYTGDNVNNLSGGIKRGSCYLGLANIRIRFNTAEAGIWKGGQFYINAANTHGASPSSQMIGDLQVSSNIEAGNHTFIQELWYKQSFGTTEFTLGLQDLNVQFANTEYGALFLNSSFGILPTISGNIPAPVYPLTALGFSARWHTSESVAMSWAVYDGCPTDFDHNPYNLNWQFKSADGLLSIAEFQYTTQVMSLPGTYKAGLYSHNHFFRGSAVPDDDPACSNNFGAYAIADQLIWKKDDKTLGSFLQVGYGPAKYNKNFLYIGTGVHRTGIFSKKGDDALGLAVALAWLKGNVGNETTIELTYKRSLIKDVFLQPDFQYIVNPAGQGYRIGNCLEGTLRLGIEF
ncbi:MAG TPA: carbohydrate porin [Bacteroidales bacterium]